MTLMTREAPGGLGMTNQCPNCSKMHLTTNPETGKSVRTPQECDRCGCPMDVEKAQEFIERKAQEAAKGNPRYAANKMVKEPAEQK